MATIKDRAVRISEFNEFKQEVERGFQEVGRRFDEVDDKFDEVEDRLDRLEHNVSLLVVNLLSEEEANKAILPQENH